MGQGQPSGPSLGHYTNMLQRFDATVHVYIAHSHSHYLELQIALGKHFNHSNHQDINFYVLRLVEDTRMDC